MVLYGLRLEYSLDGSSNYIAWKDHMEEVLEDNDLKDFIAQEVQKPTDATQLAEWKKCVTRARRILLEGVRDHIVSSLHGKETLFSMWKTLKYLYQNSSDQRKLALKDKLRKIKCEKDETISMYLTKLITCRDELTSVGVVTSDDDMEEITWSTKDGSSSMEDEENCALASKAKKGKEKVSLSESSSSNGGKKVDKSKLRCFRFHEVGHYATNCPQRKSKKGPREGSEGEALASQFELDFTLFACMVSSMVGSGWFLDIGAYFHMMGDKSLFSTLEEKDLQILIAMGNDQKYSVSGVGTVIFQREHGAHLTLIDVKYVPGLKRNLVSIVMLEDRGYDVVFSKGNIFLRHIISRQVKQIGSWVKNLYTLEVQDACKALSSKATDGDLVVEREGMLPLNMQRQKKSQTIVEEP
eukprot:PITA_10483